jgi:hypothetical protein
MKLEEIRSIARTHGIRPEQMDRIELVRAIQTAEGNPTCFATVPDRVCSQVNCLWRKDCFAESQEGSMA